MTPKVLQLLQDAATRDPAPTPTTPANDRLSVARLARPDPAPPSTTRRRPAAA